MYNVIHNNLIESGLFSQYVSCKRRNRDNYCHKYMYVNRAAEIVYALDQITLPETVPQREESQVQYTEICG